MMRLIEAFDDPWIDTECWERLLVAGPSDVLFLSLDWQREWWQAYGGDRLLLVVAEERDEPTAIAPLYVLEDMLFLVGSGGSDYLDFIGRLGEDTMTEMLDAAAREVAGFAGMTLYHVPAASKTTSLLPGVARRLGLELVQDDVLPAPYVDLTDADRVKALTGGRRLRNEENRMRREGPLVIRRAGAEDLDPWLEQFFTQHTARWKDEDGAEFEDPRHRSFCRGIVHAGHRAGWLRFTMLEWKGRPAAFNISLVHGGRQLTYLVSRDPEIRERSPGRLLDAHVISSAVQSGLRCFDFGLGDEEYKLAHASGVAEVANWSLWP